MTVTDQPNKSGVETVEHDGIRYAEIIWADTQVPITKFFSPPDSSFQFGLLAHDAGFFEPPHFHKPVTRQINDLQQMFVVQRGTVAVQLFTQQGEMFREIILKTGDAILLVHGIHAVRAIEDFQCISVKQGPFLGAENDKINVEVNNNS